MEKQIEEVEASFHDRMIELLLHNSTYENLKPMNQLKIIAILKERMKLSNRAEC